MMDISENIRIRRLQKRLTQDQLAEALFVTRQTVSNYETGRTMPDLAMLERLAEALSCDVSALLGETFSLSADGSQPEVNHFAQLNRYSSGGQAIAYATLFCPSVGDASVSPLSGGQSGPTVQAVASLDAGRPRRLRRLAIVGGAAAALFLLLFLLRPTALRWLRHWYQPALFLLLGLVVLPAVLLLLGWCVPEWLSLLLRSAPPRLRRVKKPLRRCLLVLLAALALLLLPTVLYSAVGLVSLLAHRELTWALPEVFCGSLCLHAEVLTLQQPWLYFLSGLLLWLTGFPARHQDDQKPAASEEPSA